MEQITLHNAANELDISIDTIRRWAKKGLVKAGRNENNHRIFDRSELERVKNKYLGLSKPHPYIIHKIKNNPRHSVIELFAGCGGLALGFENAGLKTELLVEVDKHACATLRRNRPNWSIEEGDIRECNSNDIFSKFKGKVEIVTGGFPCQAFSYAGKSQGFGDPRGTLFFEFLECIKAVQPKIVVGENVRGLLRHDDGRTFETMIHNLQSVGYKVAYKLLKAQFFDVPQKRERLIIMGVRDDLDMPHLFPEEKNYTVNLGEALNNIPDSVGQSYPPRKMEIMKMVPEGGYWRDLPVKVQKEYMKASFYHGGGRTGMARRLSREEPSLTLTCSPGQKQTERCHPTETRPLNVREYARIQTFPDTWEFEGSVSQQYKQIGNAVPVNLGYFLGRSLTHMLAGESNVDGYHTVASLKLIEEHDVQLELKI